jgi:glycosyltransferase involved in cell wall biosynthesis
MEIGVDSDDSGKMSDSGNDAPGIAVVCWLMPPSNGKNALNRLLKQLPPAVPLAVGVPEGSDAATVSEASKAATVQAIELPAAATLAHLANRAAERWPDADLVLVLPGVTLTESWLYRLRGAVAAESTVATVSAMSDDILSPVGDAATGQPARSVERRDSGDDPAVAVAAASAQLRPRLAGTLPTCVYVQRAALDLVGPFDELLRSNQAAVLDLALRARRRGLANLLADDLLVHAPPAELPDEDLQALGARHPSLLEAWDDPPGAAVERCLTMAGVALEPLKVTIDARALGPHVGGTQVYLLGLLESLAASGELQLRVLVGPGLDRSIQTHLNGLAGAELLTFEQALERPDPSHVVHRPQQIFSADDLLLLRPLGKRIVITHQDLIAYHNPTYFPSHALWQRFVRTTYHALGAADHVLFFSRHALADALREDLVEPARCTITHLGVDPAQGNDPMATEAVTAPGGAPQLEHTPFLLCIGADYQHKNRPFALALLDELRRTHDWPGVIVLAGPHVEHGSSELQEHEMRARRSIPPEAVVELSAVSEGERQWLMRHAAAIIYPTVHEGFGLVPFEAAAFGVPCLFAAQSSLTELLDIELATIVPWDPARSAAAAAPLLSDGPERRGHVEGLRVAAAALRWTDCARATIDAYHAALAAPYREAGADAWQALEREREIVLLAQSVERHRTMVLQLTDEIGPDGLALVGPSPLLSRADQHALLAVAARPGLRRLLLGGLRGGYRALHALRPPRG